MKKYFLCLILLWLGIALVSHAAQVNDIRLWRAPDHTRVVLDLSEPVEYTIFSLTNPDRIVIDMRYASLQADLATIRLPNSPITKIRSASRHQQDLRIVLDMQTVVKSRSFLLPAQGQQSDRLVIDLYDQYSNSTVVKTIADHADGQRDIIVAIDAGHGGEDPGAIGPGRLQEKQIVLAIANEIKQLLNQMRGYQPLMIRDGDYYVGLAERRHIARQARADLFVSIHADAFKDERARGSSVFALSDRGATSTLAQFLADEANRSDLIGGVDLADKDDRLVGVLMDLSMNHSMNASLQVGVEVLQTLGSMAHLHSRKVEQAAFKVLKSPDMPSILVETGFISNPDEAKQLNTPTYQRQIARAIVDGIQTYFTESPPMDTRVAWEQRQQGKVLQYTVARGDTLSSIAQRHHVSTQVIREHNALTSDTIKIGQLIVVPML